MSQRARKPEKFKVTRKSPKNASGGSARQRRNYDINMGKLLFSYYYLVAFSLLSGRPPRVGICPPCVAKTCAVHPVLPKRPL